MRSINYLTHRFFCSILEYRLLEVLEQLQLDLILAKKGLWFTLEAA